MRHFELVATTVLLASGCASTDAHHHHGGMPHRFDNAEQWAREFDDPQRDAWQRPQTVIDAMRIANGMTIADIGAGTGYFEPWLSRAAGERGVVMALDVEPDMVRYLGERAQREHLANVRAAHIAGDDPGLPAAAVDRVLIVDTWHHIDGRTAYAAKLRDALTAAGMVIVVDFKPDATRGPPPEHRLSAETIIHELEAGGLRASLSAADLPEQFIVVATKRDELDAALGSEQ